MLWSEPASKVFWGQRNFRQIQFANASYFEKGVYALHLESSWYRRHTILTCLYPRISTPRLLFSADLCWHRLSLLSFVPTPKFPFVWKRAKLWTRWQPKLFIVRPGWLSSCNKKMFLWGCICQIVGLPRKLIWSIVTSLNVYGKIFGTNIVNEDISSFALENSLGAFSSVVTLGHFVIFPFFVAESEF